MTRRIIFLDVDGVLNHVAFRKTTSVISPVGTPPELRGLQLIDPDAVERLNALVEKTGAEVVLSSSWRVRGVDGMQTILAAAGFRAELVDRTPLRAEYDPAVYERLRGEPPVDEYSWPRGYEIQQWLDDHHDVESIVILDDASSMEHLMPWLVQTSLRDGLLDTHIDMAIEVLEQPGPPRTRAAGAEPTARVRWDMPETELMSLVARRLSRKTGDRLLLDPRDVSKARRIAARTWLDYLEAFDRWWRWAHIGRRAEAEGRLAEANACFAAASWLQPDSADPVIDRVIRRRGDELSAQLRRLHDHEFPTLTSRDRHRRAWSLGEDGLAGVPTLMRWACDPNPSVRAQIYRSLGFASHPAAIQILQEGTLDPDPNARVEAVRALGWLADPSFFAQLETLAGAGHSAVLRRTAVASMQRICGYWAYFGEWHTIAASPARATEVGRALLSAGLPIIAADVLDLFGAPLANPVARELLDRLDVQRADHSAVYVPPPETAASDDGAATPDLVWARTNLAAAGAPGFEARRVMRFVGLGALEERRAQTVARFAPS